MERGKTVNVGVGDVARKASADVAVGEQCFVE